MTEAQIERNVQLGARNMARDATRAMESQRADDAFELEDATRQRGHAALEAAYVTSVAGWPDIEAALHGAAEEFGVDPQREAAAEHELRMVSGRTLGCSGRRVIGFSGAERRASPAC